MSYPLPVFHFQVQWGGNSVAFTEVSGLTAEAQPIEYRTGDRAEFSVQKMPGIKKYANITLKRGIMAGDNAFHVWLTTLQSDEDKRRDLTISLLNEEHKPVVTWTVLAAWPVKVDGPSLNSTGNEVAVETIELAHEGLTTEHN